MRRDLLVTLGCPLLPSPHLGKKTMQTILRLIKWLWRAWPVLIPLAIVCVHLLLIYYFGLNARVTNKTISLFSQLGGGLLVLYSINSNIGIMKGKNIFSSLANYVIVYFSEFPLFKKSTVIELQATSMSISGGKAKATVVRNPKFIEEKIEYLQEQINEVRVELEREAKELTAITDRLSHAISAQTQETTSALRTIETKIDNVSIGNIEYQLFGVFLIIYGSVSGYFA